MAGCTLPFLTLLSNEITAMLRHLLKPASRAFFKEARRADDCSLLDALHGYIYGRWIYLYIAIGTGEHRLSRLLYPLAKLGQRLSALFGRPQDITFADTYHGKVVTPDGARQLVTVNQPLVLQDLEQVIPYARARDIILKNPEHIVALDCPCRSARAEPCLPLDVCLVIGEPFASFVLAHHPRKSRAISQQQALEVLAAEHKRGHVHHAFFKEANLNRFYAICNCCSCCCGAIQAMENGTPMLASSGYVASLDPQLCTGCGSCLQLCQFQAMAWQGNDIIFHEERCLGCGVCLQCCPTEARAMVAVPERGQPLEIRTLLAEASQKL